MLRKSKQRKKERGKKKERKKESLPTTACRLKEVASNELQMTE
jgi:hypothetical protein